VNDKQDTEAIKQPEIEPEPASETVTGWQFVAEDTPGKNKETAENPGTKLPSAATKPVTWSEAEFIAHHKSFGWYVLLGLAALIIATPIYLYYHDLISVIVIAVAAVALGIVANRQPRIMEYKIDDTGLSIGEKFYSYDNFRSFSVVNEGLVSSLVFRPLRRFMPLITIYYPPKDEKAILGALSRYLPVDNHQPDAIDSLMRRIHY
jgi:uncharacterized membrane protein